MKRSLHYVFMLMLCTVALFSQTIDEQIKNIMNATPQERVQLMNQLKTQISTMNQEKQTDAIKALQRQMGGANDMRNTTMQQHRLMQQSPTGEQNHQQMMMRLQSGSGINGQRQNGRQ